MVREQTRRFAVAEGEDRAGVERELQPEQIPQQRDPLLLTQPSQCGRLRRLVDQDHHSGGQARDREPPGPGCSLSSGSVPWCCWSSPPRGRGPDGGRWGSA
jgi:hypothetical protein